MVFSKENQDKAKDTLQQHKFAVLYLIRQGKTKQYSIFVMQTPREPKEVTQACGHLLGIHINKQKKYWAIKTDRDQLEAQLSEKLGWQVSTFEFPTAW